MGERNIPSTSLLLRTGIKTRTFALCFLVKLIIMKDYIHIIKVCEKLGRVAKMELFKGQFSDISVIRVLTKYVLEK